VFIVQLIIYFILGTIPVLFAAVQPWVWSFYTACIFATFLIILWQNSSHLALFPGKILVFTVGFFFVVTFCQYLPIPPDMLSFLSPIRYQRLVNSHTIIDSLLTWQTLSYSPIGYSLSWWTFLLSLFTFFLVLRKHCASRRNLTFIIWVMMVVATLEALYGLFQALVPTIGILWLDPKKTGNACGTFINRNHFAGFMEMLWPLVLGYTLSLGAWHRKDNHRGGRSNSDFKKVLSSDRLNKQLILLLLIVVMLLALLFSKSRAGITGAFIGFLSFVLLAHSGIKRRSIGFWIMIGTIIGLVFIYGLKMGFSPIIERFLMLSDGSSRLDYWHDSLAIFYDHPFGIGLGNFKRVFPVYQISIISDVKVSHLHNDYLQLLIEAGVPGFLSLVCGYLFFLGTSFYKMKKLSPHDDPLRFFLAIGALSGLVSMTFHSFFDFNLQIPANCIYFVTLISLVYVCVWQRSTRRRVKV